MKLKTEQLKAKREICSAGSVIKQVFQTAAILEI